MSIRQQERRNSWEHAHIQNVHKTREQTTIRSTTRCSKFVRNKSRKQSGSCNYVVSSERMRNSTCECVEYGSFAIPRIIPTLHTTVHSTFSTELVQHRRIICHRIRCSTCCTCGSSVVVQNRFNIGCVHPGKPYRVRIKNTICVLSQHESSCWLIRFAALICTSS